MIVSKIKLLFSLILLMVAVVWTPILLNEKETGGLHWLYIRLPLMIGILLAIYLFNASITKSS